MAEICPLCNALQTVGKVCPRCGAEMADGGMVANYFGPYSPYRSDEGKDSSALYGHHCVHLLYCPVCRYDERLTISMVNI